MKEKIFYFFVALIAIVTGISFALYTASSPHANLFEECFEHCDSMIKITATTPSNIDESGLLDMLSVHDNSARQLYQIAPSADQ